MRDRILARREKGLAKWLKRQVIAAAGEEMSIGMAQHGIFQSLRYIAW
jgi:hypothetical protein